MATTKIDIKKALNPEWLIRNNCSLVLPTNKVHRLRLLKIIWHGIKRKTNQDKTDVLLKISISISRRTFQRIFYAEFKYTPGTVGKKIMEDKETLNLLKTETFIVEVIENATSLPKYNFNVKLKNAEEIKIIPPKQYINPKNVEEIKQSLVILETVTEISSEADKEAVALKICEYLATGQVDLNTATNKYGVASKDFMLWMHTNQVVQDMFGQAMSFAKFQKKLTQGLALDTKTDELLQRGYVETETVNYRKVFNQFHPEGLWIETTKSITRRGLDERGIAMLHSVFNQTELPEISMDEFDALDMEQQYELVQSLMTKRNSLKDKKE